MQVVREITEDEEVSDVEYSTFEAEEHSGSVQHLQKEMQSEVFATLHLRSVEEESPHQRCHSCAKCFKIFVQVALVAIIWMAVCVPSVVYVHEVLRNNGSSKSSSSNKSNDSADIFNGTAVRYDGEVCRSDLSAMQACLNRFCNKQAVNNTIWISSLVDQDNNEDKVSQLQSYEQFIPSIQCREELRPFICLHFFPLVLCEGDSCFKFGPTRQRCEMLRDGVCSTIWYYIESEPQAPQCQSFSSSGPDLINSSCIGDIVRPITQINCTEGFESTNGTCVPQCQVWSPYRSTEVLITDILVISTAVFALLISVCVLILGCLRCRKICTYPSIFAIYQTIPLMIIAGLVVVGFIWRKQLFCTSPNLIEALNKPSHFCLATGLAFHYFITQLPFWWTCHVIAVFLNTLFPYQMRRMQCTKRLRCLHVFMVAAGILLPMVSMAIVTAYGKFTLNRMPTYLCVGSNKHAVFGATIVPITIAIGVGSTLMLFILSTVIKRHIQAHVHQLRVRLDWTAEAKVFIALFYFLILGVVIISILTHSLIDLDSFLEELPKYFLCKASGISDEPDELEMGQNGTVPSQMCSKSKRRLDELSEPVSSTIAMMLLGLYPIVYLIYIINIRELKETWCTRTVREVEPSQKSASANRKKKPPAPYAPIGNNDNQNHPSYYTRVGDTSNVAPSSFPGFGVDAYERPSTFTPPAI